MKKIYNVAIFGLILFLVSTNIYLVDRINHIENRVFSLPTHVPSTPSFNRQFEELQTNVSSVVYEVTDYNSNMATLNFEITMASRLPDTKLVFQYNIVGGNEIFEHELESYAPLKYSIDLELETKNYEYRVVQVQNNQALTSYNKGLFLSNVGSILSAKANIDDNGNLEIIYSPSENAKISSVDVFLSEMTLAYASQSIEVSRRVFSTEKVTDMYIVTIDQEVIEPYDIEDIELEMFIYVENHNIINHKYLVSDLLEEVLIPLWVH